MHWFLLLFCFWTLTTEAKVVRLFDANGDQVDAYDAILYRLEPGDLLEFENDARYEFQKYLGQGKVSAIVQVKPFSPLGTDPGTITALRLPKYHNMNPKNGARFPVTFLDYSIDEYPKLIRENVPVPPPYKMVEHQYIEMRLQHPEFDFDWFFTEGEKLPVEKRKLVMDQLLEFAKKTAHFRKIGDFSGAQIVFDSKLQEWILIDFSTGSKLITEKSLLQRIGFPASSIFRIDAKYLLWEKNLLKNKKISYSPFQNDVLKMISAAVKEERKVLGYASGLCRFQMILKKLFKP